jgi:hypothetical protein
MKNKALKMPRKIYTFRGFFYVLKFAHSCLFAPFVCADEKEKVDIVGMEGFELNLCKYQTALQQLPS